LHEISLQFINFFQYGCGDFLNDYEGISGYEEFRSELTLMYFPTVEMATGRLLKFDLVPLRIRHFKLNRTTTEEREWMLKMLRHEYGRFGVSVRAEQDYFSLQW
jgi:poly-gamma-glutamate synthesis protein (capsule biosynthesis protein)